MFYINREGQTTKNGLTLTKVAAGGFKLSLRLWRFGFFIRVRAKNKIKPRIIYGRQHYG